LISEDRVVNDFLTFKRSPLRDGIPAGKTRVISVDLFSHEEDLVQDCDTRVEALKLAVSHNKRRTGSMDDVYYVYDDKGNPVDDRTIDPVGVSP